MGDARRKARCVHKAGLDKSLYRIHMEDTCHTFQTSLVQYVHDFFFFFSMLIADFPKSVFFG